MHLAPEPAARDEHQTLGALRELVGELHGDAAAERMADDRHALVPERRDDVTGAAGVRAERVVAARCRGLPVAQEVGCDQREAVAQQRRHPLPRRGRVGDPVDEQQRRPAARRPIGHAVAVEPELVRLEGHRLHDSTDRRLCQRHRMLSPPFGGYAAPGLSVAHSVLRFGSWHRESYVRGWMIPPRRGWRA